MKSRLLIAATLLMASSYVNGGAEDETAPTDAIAGARRDKILAEIEHLGAHDWAGVYDSSVPLGQCVHLVMAPRAGFVMESAGCLRAPDEYGDVLWDANQGRLTLRFETAHSDDDKKLTLVRWGERIYLVEDEDMVRFCSSVNAGSEPRSGYGGVLLSEGGEKKRVSGKPGVPAAYAAYVLAKPIAAKVVSVGPSVTRPNEAGCKDTPVVLDCGAQHGLLVGMRLWVVDPLDEWQSVYVTKVEDVNSEATMEQFGEGESGPQVGWRLSTRSPFCDRELIQKVLEGCSP